MRELKETHREGALSVENLEEHLDLVRQSNEIDFGLQIAKDGRVWVCLNGIAFLRFKPSREREW